MERSQLFLSTIDPHAGEIAWEAGVGLEIAEYCTAANADTFFDATDANVRREIEGVPLRTLHGAFNELFPCAIDPLARRLANYRYAQALELAKKYHAVKLILHGGYSPALYYPCWYIERSVVFWKEFLKENRVDIEICLENVMEEEPEMLLSIVRQVNDPRLRLCLDVGHINKYSKIPALEWIKCCGGWLSHLHLHNNDGSSDSHSVLYDGTLPMAEIISGIGKNMTAALEIIELGDSVRWLEKNGLLK